MRSIPRLYDPKPVSPSRTADAAVVLIDRDSSRTSPATVAAVAAAAGSRAVEVVVVDATTEQDRPRADIGRVRLLPGDHRLTDVTLRSQAWAKTSEPIVCFLDCTALPRPNAIAAALEAFDDDPAVAAVSALASEIGEPTLTCAGTIGAFHAADDSRRHKVLYPVPEAAVFRRSAVDNIGGLDTDLGWSAAVVELGWRLGLDGQRVVLDPNFAVDVTCSCTPDGYSGLVLLHRCLGHRALERLLPEALRIGARRDELNLQHGSAIDRFIEHSPRLVRRRAEVQAARSVDDDDEFLALLITPCEAGRGEEALAAVYDDIRVRGDLAGVVYPRQRILVVTPDLLTPRMAGPAIRAWEIANALARRHQVHLASTAERVELSSSRFAVSAPPDRTFRELAGWADVIVAQGFALEGRPYLRDETKVLVVDLYDPVHLEQLELFKDDTDIRRRLTVRGAVRVLNEQLARGDFFVCASPKQRDFWLGQLAGLGRVNHLTYDDDPRLRSLLDVVPFGLPDSPPRPVGRVLKGVLPGIDAEDEVILWGGGIYNWFDPLTLIRAVDRLRRRRANVRLFFMGLRHPNPDVQEMRVATEARRLARELELTNRYVFFNDDWVPYADRQSYLLEADVGVSTHFDHLETEFSFRTRILDYIWATLPIVATEGDWFAELIALEGLGLTVPAQDVECLEEALFRVLDDEMLRKSSREALSRVAGEFAWSEVLAPIIAFCNAPRRAADMTDPEMRSSLWMPDEQKWDLWERSLPKTVRRVRRILATL